MSVFAARNVSLLRQLSNKMAIRGIIPGARMFSIQEGLPKLPVPALDQTLQKYLNSVQILVSDDQFRQTQQVVADFQKKVGPKLQDGLLDYAKDKDNWLADWWTDVAYLGNRLPVTINVNPGTCMPPGGFTGEDRQIQHPTVNINPGTCMPPGGFTGEDRQIQHAAHVIGGVLDYKRQIDDQSLAVEYLGKRPLCMSQFYKIFNGCRIPGNKVDSWVCYPPYHPNPPTHIVVAHKNCFYRVEVYDRHSQILSVSAIYHQLRDIVERSSSDAPPVGILTTMQRDDWSQAYNHLTTDNQNASNCEVINRSVVNVCLDKPYTLGSHDPNMADSLQACIHGRGSQWNTGNRWFDKTLQFVVGSDNESGTCYEHTSAEGPPITSLMDHVVKFVRNKQSIVASPNTGDFVGPIELAFNVDSTTQQWINRASENVDKSISELVLRAFTYEKYGKSLIKQNKLSPDAYLQQAIQLAYHRAHNEPGNTYESGSTRMFQYGRTDTIRSCTTESQAFVRAVDQSGVSTDQKAGLLRGAVGAHRMVTDQVVSGQGIDRHMLGLKLTAINSSLPLPDLFTDPSFADFMGFKLSTSQVTSKSEAAAMAYGPAMVDGYGVCYNPADDQLYFTVTTFKQSSVTQVDKYTELLHLSLDDMMKLLASSQRSKL